MTTFTTALAVLVVRFVAPSGRAFAGRERNGCRVLSP